jgi:hypothetical protein
MSPYELENLPHTLKRVRTQSIFVIRLEVMPLQVIGQTPGAHRRVGVITGGAFYGKHLSGKVLGGAATGSLFVMLLLGKPFQPRTLIPLHRSTLHCLSSDCPPPPEKNGLLLPSR